MSGWVAVDSREHHDLTEQSDPNGLLHLCQSLQDLLKYCWVPLGGKDRGWDLNDVQMHSDVRVFVHVIYTICLVCRLMGGRYSILTNPSYITIYLCITKYRLIAVHYCLMSA